VHHVLDSRDFAINLRGAAGTGKTYLLTVLCVDACRQKRRVRLATAAALVNEVVEAKQQLKLRSVLARWERYDLIAIDAADYVPMARLGAEFLFQVIAERAKKATVIITTNLPFSERSQVIPNLAPERNFDEAQDEFTTKPKVWSPATLDHWHRSAKCGSLAQNLKTRPVPARRLFSTPVVALGSCVRSQAASKARMAR
jgi:hypothetical protein